MLKVISVLLSCLIFIGNLSAQTYSAKSCPQGYSQIDQKFIKSLFADNVIPLLSRMKEISYLASFTSPLVRMNKAQRLAYESEFQAELSYIGQLGSTHGLPLQPDSNLFLIAALDPINLGISGLTLSGPNRPSAEQNSAIANAALTGAITKVWKCF